MHPVLASPKSIPNVIDKAGDNPTDAKRYIIRQ